MNPAKAYSHLFSPLGGDDADNYRAPGQITFLRSSHVGPKAGALKQTSARFAFVGVPFDEGNVGKPGCEDGPREFRLASQEYFPYWFEFKVDLAGSSVDCGDVQMPKVNPPLAHDRIYHAVREVLAAGLIPILCGGDRSISIPAARALSDHLGPDRKMGCLHFGAHLEMAESWAGERHLAPCAMARMTEIGNCPVSHVAHVGARNSMIPKDHVDLADARGVRFYPMHELLERGVDTVAAEAIDRVWEGTDSQYLSFNLNVMDSSAAPGVTASEPGGLEAREMMRIARRIGARGSVGLIELSELSPVYDVSGTTAKLAVCIVLRIMAAMAQARGDTVPDNIKREQLTM